METPELKLPKLPSNDTLILISVAALCVMCWGLYFLTVNNDQRITRLEKARATNNHPTSILKRPCDCKDKLNDIENVEVINDSSSSSPDATA